jgi:hypothetical protein
LVITHRINSGESTVNTEPATDDLKQNRSKASVDGRSIMQIIYEKAVQGTSPQHFALSNNPEWHTIHWPNHPNLTAIRFSDDSVIYVNESVTQVAAAEAAQAATQVDETSQPLKLRPGNRPLKLRPRNQHEVDLDEEDFTLSPEQLAAKIAARKEE